MNNLKVALGRIRSGLIFLKYSICRFFQSSCITGAKKIIKEEGSSNGKKTDVSHTTVEMIKNSTKELSGEDGVSEDFIAECSVTINVPIAAADSDPECHETDDASSYSSETEENNEVIWLFWYTNHSNISMFYDFILVWLLVDRISWLDRKHKHVHWCTGPKFG